MQLNEKDLLQIKDLCESIMAKIELLLLSIKEGDIADYGNNDQQISEILMFCEIRRQELITKLNKIPAISDNKEDESIISEPYLYAKNQIETLIGLLQTGKAKTTA
jgi:hypothetical protein